MTLLSLVASREREERERERERFERGFFDDAVQRARDKEGRRRRLRNNERRFFFVVVAKGGEGSVSEEVNARSSSSFFL